MDVGKRYRIKYSHIINRPEIEKEVIGELRGVEDGRLVIDTDGTGQRQRYARLQPERVRSVEELDAPNVNQEAVDELTSQFGGFLRGLV